MSNEFRSSPIEPTQTSRIQKQQEIKGKEIWVQIESSEAMTENRDEVAFSPLSMSRRMESLEEKTRKKASEKEKTEKTEEGIGGVERVAEVSEEFEQRNPELHSRNLQLLYSQAKKQNTPEDLLRHVLETYPDHSLADEALEFLTQTTTGDTAEKVKAAKENLLNNFGREVKAGRNIATQAREFSQMGLGSPTGLRDLYRDITGNPREATTLFNELVDKFSYENMKTTIDFILHSLGADLKAKGPSIPPGELHRLMTEGRNLLAILWVFRFFNGRMNLIKDAFERNGQPMPEKVTFEMLARMFVQFLRERYPSMDKVLQMALKMGISIDLLAQMILFTQMRDAVRGVAPKLFRSEQHRYDVLMSFIEALEELDEQMEKEEEEEEEEK